MAPAGSKTDCYVTAPIGQQPNVVNEAQPQTPAPQRIYLRKTHKVLSILQMIVGCLCFTVEAVGVCIGPANGILYTGIYTGVFFTITGRLGFLAIKKNNPRLLVACLVMSILSAGVCFVGAIIPTMEMIALTPRFKNANQRFAQNVKQYILMAISIFEFVVSIIHASICCGSCCSCCWPVHRRWTQVTNAVNATIIQTKQPNHMDAHAYPIGQQDNAPPAVAMKPGQETFPALNLYGASSVSPPPYEE